MKIFGIKRRLKLLAVVTALPFAGLGADVMAAYPMPGRDEVECHALADGAEADETDDPPHG